MLDAAAGEANFGVGPESRPVEPLVGVGAFVLVGADVGTLAAAPLV